MDLEKLLPYIINMLIGAAVFTIIKLNEVKHLKDLHKENKKEIDSLWKEINKGKDERKEIIDRLSHIEGMLNGKSD